MAKDFPVPIFFSETGCNVPGPRLFADQASILGPDMADLWSGAIVYEWIEEQNHYGLVSYGPKVDQSIVNDVVYDGFTRKGVPTPVQPDFNNLKSQWATLNPTGISAAAYVPTVSTRDCPRSTPGGWEVDGNVRLPTLGESYTYAPLPTQSRGSGSGSGSGGSGTSGNSPSGTGPDGSSSTNAGSHASGNMVVTMGGALMGVFLIFIYWL